MSKASDLTIIIPAFNEESAVGRVVCGLSQVLPEAEIIVVNDGSSDNTAQISRDSGAIVIDHDRNMGYGASLRTGVKAAKRSVLLFFDADGQHLPADAERLFCNFKGCDMIIGKRNTTFHINMIRAPGRFILKKFANFLAGQKLPDFNSGLRAVKKEVLIKYLHLMPNTFSFSTTCTFALLKGNYIIKWLPITVQKRVGKSTVRQWKHGPQVLMLMLRLTILFEPL
ncbi:MAG: glycosyltransferase family 2 protein, partial [Dehalococcoidia bacterium]